MAELKSGKQGGIPDPLLLFPAETWEYILGKLSDSRDIQNVFKAIPVLEDLVLKNKYWWLLDQVLPHIFPHMIQKEVLSCRQICQRWTQVVDNFLENLPTERAYEHGVEQAYQPWILDPSQTNDYFKPYHKYSKSFYSKHAQNLSTFLRGMDVHPAGRNPIVGRSVAFNDAVFENLPAGVGRLEYGEVMSRRSTDYWNMAMEGIRVLGDHIWFLTLCFEYLASLGRIPPVVIESLQSLPNLKLLRFEFLGHDSQPEHDSRYDAEWLKRHLESLPQESHLQLEPLPPLPHLESLEFYHESDYRTGFPNETVNLLITSYSTQIRKLEIFHGFWRKEFCKLFPKLTEVIFFGWHDKQTAVELLLSLEAPDLYHLRLEFDGLDAAVDADDIISCLGRFKKLAVLTLNLDFDSNEGNKVPCGPSALSPSGSITVPSLKSFEIVCYMDSKINFDFLQRFPSLEHLKIPAPFGTVRPHGVVVKFPNFFEMLPKLKKVILPRDRGSELIFTRVNYDYAKGKWGLVEPPPSGRILDALRLSCFPWNEQGQPQNFDGAVPPDPDDEDWDGDDNDDDAAADDDEDEDEMEFGQPEPDDDED